MTTKTAAEILAHEILAPVVSRAVEAADDVTYAEQLEGWVADAINNGWSKGVTGERLAAKVAAKLGLTI